MAGIIEWFCFFDFKEKFALVKMGNFSAQNRAF